MNTSKYFFQSLAVVVVSTLSFLAFKTFLPKKLFSESTFSSKNIVVDSLLLEAIAEDGDLKSDDTLSEKNIDYKITNGIKFPTETFDDYTGNQYLATFFEELFQLETKKEGNVRIAYFGDSMTDGDMIVQDVRKLFQEQFGGQGVGFVNITSESASSRATVTHEFSNNWKTQTYLKVKRPIRSFGVNGHVFFANDTLHSTWARYKANNYKHLTQLNNPTLYYGNSTNKDAMISYMVGKDTIYKKLNGENQLNTIKLADNLKSVKVNFINAQNVPIYGFNFDDGKGVHVDNFSNRGNSGLPISIFNVGMMQEFQAKLQYDLVILHYGTNVLNYGSYDYSWYEKRMTKVVEHIKQCFPGVAVLIVSTADKSTKYDLEIKTDSAVVPLAMAQKKYAVKSEAGFVNIYTIMGGDGSMVKWTEAVPPKANKDYTHFNYTGSKEIAKLIYDEIYSGYTLFKTLNKGFVVPKRKNDSVYTKIDSTNE